jgi:predicted transcriptional regulator
MAKDEDEKPKVQISIRVDSDDLAELEQIGGLAKPVPANRNQMIGAAIRDYVDRHGKKKGK